MATWESNGHVTSSLTSRLVKVSSISSSGQYLKFSLPLPTYWRSPTGEELTPPVDSRPILKNIENRKNDKGYITKQHNDKPASDDVNLQM